MDLLQRTLAAIQPLDEAAMAAAAARQNRLTKPTGSLGRLEELSIRLAGIQGQPIPQIKQMAIVTMAGDHGVVRDGVSAYPADVTPQMVLNFLHGGAGINVLSRHVGARISIVDMGVAVDLPPNPQLIVKKVGYGTASILQGPAMTRDQAVQALEAGIEVVEAEIAKGADLVGTGDMGIGNTTPSAAITASITGAPVANVTGRGTGLDDAGLDKKVAVIEKALAVNRPDPADALDVLAKVGGFEIGGLAGVMLGAAAHRVPVVVDGFISSAAALLAAGLCPQAAAYMIAGHRSVEGGQAYALAHLKLEPILDLHLRLGEGTGAALAMSIVQAAAKILAEMATFDEAGVSDKE